MLLNVVGTYHDGNTFFSKTDNKNVTYDNYYLYCLKEIIITNDHSEGSGFSVKEIKIKAKDLSRVFGADITDDDFHSLKNRNINVFYNENRQLDSIILAEVS